VSTCATTAPRGRARERRLVPELHSTGGRGPAYNDFKGDLPHVPTLLVVVCTGSLGHQLWKLQSLPRRPWDDRGRRRRRGRHD
jgi:hypothetical protein